MSRRTPWLVALALVASALISLPSIADSWDAYSDFSSTVNNPGPHDWSYGWINTTDISSGYTLTFFTKSDIYGSFGAWHETQGTGGAGGGIQYPYLGKNSGGSNGRVAGTSMSAFPPTLGYTILRWIAPVGVTGTHTIIFPIAQNGAASTINVIKNPGASQIIMFTGTSSCAYRGMATFAAGDVLDFMFGPNTASGWAYQNFSLKIMPGDYTQSGRVIDAEGNGLAGATVTLVSASPAYAVMTDSAGYYKFILAPGSYNVKAAKSAYTTSANVPTTVSAAGGSLPTVTIQRTGTWDIKADWSSAGMSTGNPNGQWSYGQSSGTGPSGYNFSLLTVAGVGETGDKVGYWGTQATASGQTIAAPAVGYNTGSSALGSFAGSKVTLKPGSGDKAMARWTAPAAGWYTFTATFNASDGNAVVKTNGSTFTTLAGPGAVSGWAGARNMAAGDSIDFIASAASSLDATVKTGATGVSGYVEDANHVRLAGALVQRVGGTECAISDSAGNYVLGFGSSGKYTVQASKPGYDPLTISNITVGSSFVTTNFTLPVGAAVSGTLTDSLPPYAAVVGANVWSSDGAYAAMTDSAGYYSFPMVTHGTQVLNYARIGYAPQAITVGVSGSAVTQNVSMNQGWDLATDLTTANPNGPWSYGYDLGPGTEFTNMTNAAVDSSGIEHFMTVNEGQSGNQTMLIKNTGFAPFSDTSASLPVWREAQKVIASPGITYIGMTGAERTIARFTAPSTGYFTVTAGFAGAATLSPYTTHKVALRKGASYLLGDPAASASQLDGFAGRSQNSYTDSTGAASVVSYSQGMDIAAGDTIDAVIYGLDGGWTQLDLTITMSDTVVTGQVTSDLPGNPPVANALVTLTGGSTYTVLTDTSGNYLIGVKPDSYTVQVTHTGFAATSDALTLSTPQIVTRDYCLHHNGTWDAAQDFTTTTGAGGQWSCGYIDQAAGNSFTPFTARSTGTPSDQAQTLANWTTTDSGASNAQLGTNYGAAPVLWTASGAHPYYWYIEPGALFMASGDRNHLAALRWTSPDARVITIQGSCFMQCGAGGTQAMAILKNGTPLGNRAITGFAGRAAVGFTDSFGANPAQPFQVSISVLPGDVIDFVHDFDYQTGTGWSIGQGANGDPCMSIGLTTQISTGAALTDARLMPDGAIVGRTGLVVSKVFDDCAYLETSDRSHGMRVASAGALVVGQTVDVTGTLKTTSDGERYIDATTVTVTGTSGVESMLLTNKDLGGGPNNFNATTGAGQRGVEDGAGLNNIGLFIKTTGKVTVAGDGFFYIDDGTHAKDASIFSGVRVWCPPGTDMPAVGSQVAVTGISSIYDIGGRHFRGVRIGGASDWMTQ